MSDTWTCEVKKKAMVSIIVNLYRSFCVRTRRSLRRTPCKDRGWWNFKNYLDSDR